MRDPAAEAAAHLLDLTFGLVRTLRTDVLAHADLDLKMPQFRTLAFLAHNPGSSVSDVADHSGLTLAAASKTLDLLADRGFLERSPHAHDRRRVAVDVTRAGRKKVDHVKRRARQVLAERLSRLDRPHLVRLADSLAPLPALLSSKRTLLA